MRKRMQQRVALFLSFAMAFTSVDSSVLVAASDVTEIVSEETHDHASEEAFLAEEAQPDNAEATAISEEVESVTEADLGMQKKRFWVTFLKVRENRSQEMNQRHLMQQKRPLQKVLQKWQRWKRTQKV